MIGTNRMLCVEEVMSYMDTTELVVANHQAMLGTVKTWRVNGSLPADMNTGTSTTVVSETAQRPTLSWAEGHFAGLIFSAIRTAMAWSIGWMARSWSGRACRKFLRIITTTN